MGFSESERRCKEHPQHQEKLGVCPYCLRESLSRLCSSSAAAHSCSSSLYFSPANYSSASSSKSSSPARRRLVSHKRNGSEVMGSLAFMVKVGNGLKKSRSIAFVPRSFDGDQVEEVKNIKNKKKGFWSKLFSFKGKKDVLKHSTSMRFIERVI